MGLAHAANCSGCRLAPKEDGGDGSCPRTVAYPELKLLPLHDCLLFRRRPRPRPKPETGAQEALF